jgi:Uma2 family endonuclease
MSSATTTKRMTVEEFCDWVHQPENADKWFELVRGEVIELPPPQKPHGVVAINVGRLLSNFTIQRNKGYVTCNDAGVLLERDPDTVRGPDVAVYEDAESFEEIHPKYGEVPPRLAVEVLSPSDRADRIQRKITDYLRNGVELVWVVDTEEKTVTVYRADNGPRVLQEQDEITGEDVLPGFRCVVAEFFFIPGKRPLQPQKPARKPGKRRGKS